MGCVWREQGGAASLTRVWDEELAPQGIHFLSLDPGDMDTPLHALAVPDADPSTLKRPEAAAREIADAIAARLRDGAGWRDELEAVGVTP